ncbi:MAG: lipoprotein-releasing ABC transporter permease subunit [Pseudomonadota bacterium]
MLAMRYLRARRKEGFISVIAGFSFIGIMLGVATLIIVMAVMNGFHAQLFGKMLGLNGHVAAFKISETGAFEGYDDLATKLANVDGTISATPLVEGQVLVSSPASAVFGIVRGISEQGLANTPLVSNNAIAGSFAGFGSGDGIALGRQLAESVRLQVGDFVKLISPRGTSTPFGTAPRSKSFRIAAIFDMGMSEYNKTMVFMPLGLAQKFFSKRNTVDVVEVKVTDPKSVERNVAAFEKAVGDGVVYQTWKQRNQSFFTVLEVERTLMFIILSLIILVAALNVISGMMMLVKDKSRDIAIMRTMGATRNAMLRVFLITGASIGVVGTIAGFILGIVFCWNIESIRQGVQWLTGTTLMDPKIYYLSKLPAEIDPVETGLIVAFALGLSVLATIYPSWRAANLDPVEALRYE